MGLQLTVVSNGPVSSWVFVMRESPSDIPNACLANGHLRWIVGALDSAWAAVLKYHHLSNRSGELEAFYMKWGKNLEWFGHNALSDDHKETTAKRHHGLGGASRHTKRGEIPDEEEIEVGKEEEADRPAGPSHVPRSDHNLLLSYMILQNPDLVEFIDY